MPSLPRYYPPGTTRKPRYVKEIPTFEHEEWRPIPGFDGVYSVSNQGRIFSHKFPGKMLTPAPAGRNSASNVRVRLSRGGAAKDYRVHLLVLEAFVGPRPSPDACGLHADDDIWNNRVENLRWGTRSDNWHDANRNGRAVAGTATHRDKYGQPQTQCKYGHEFTPKNTYIRPGSGHKMCRICMKDRDRKMKETMPEDMRERRRQQAREYYHRTKAAK
jgi:NUMOD4 motif/HNH endonuclease